MGISKFSDVVPTYGPTLASEVAKLLQYASVVWLVSTSVADNFLLLFLVLVLAAIL